MRSLLLAPILVVIVGCSHNESIQAESNGATGSGGHKMQGRRRRPVGYDWRGRLRCGFVLLGTGARRRTREGDLRRHRRGSTSDGHRGLDDWRCRRRPSNT